MPLLSTPAKGLIKFSLLFCSIDTREENEENPELFKIRFSEVLDLAGGDGLLTLGKFSDTMVCT